MDKTLFSIGFGALLFSVGTADGSIALTIALMIFGGAMCLLGDMIHKRREENINE